jgi:hypothetical protein
MKRIDPTFKEQTLINQDNIDFLDELFNNLFDSDDLSENTDKIPDLSILDR